MPRKKKTHEPRACVICGTVLTPRASNHICCCHACSQKHGRAMPNAIYHANKKRMARKCIICGKEFQPVNGSQICCGKECYAKRKVNLDASYRDARKSKDKIATMTLAEINERARAEGMLYGAYVAKYGL